MQLAAEAKYRARIVRQKAEDALKLAEKRYQQQSDKSAEVIGQYVQFDSIFKTLRKDDNVPSSLVAHAAMRRAQCRAIVGDLDGLTEDTRHAIEYGANQARWKKELDSLTEVTRELTGTFPSHVPAYLPSLKSGVYVRALEPVDSVRAPRMSAALKSMGIDAGSVKRFVEKKLSKAGIKILSEEESTKHNYGTTVLVKTSCMITDSYGTHSVQLRVSQQVVVEPEHIWYPVAVIHQPVMYMGISSKKDLRQHLMESVRKSVDELIRGVLSKTVAPRVQPQRLQNLPPQGQAYECKKNRLESDNSCSA